MIRDHSVNLNVIGKWECLSLPKDSSTSNEGICFGLHLNNLRRRNIGRLILAHININSIRYKFYQLVYGVKGKVDVLMITETKLDDSFPTMQFNTEGYHTFR